MTSSCSWLYSSVLRIFMTRTIEASICKRPRCHCGTRNERGAANLVTPLQRNGLVFLLLLLLAHRLLRQQRNLHLWRAPARCEPRSLSRAVALRTLSRRDS
jgi:hypothetical protein